ncbi:uncharacterized protein LOC108914978 [Anoplophora glabripennis]|uniref:uncharacterized protein LOC108914978 n=1 Tax=Anoplophora glabripennis TaxID=217634 RepID=UPI000875A4A6|nr:uncharacterized protein LOC108914978 [Anoplophora glabripennis]
MSDLKPGTRYNSNTWGVDANKNIVPLQQDTGLFPGAHKNYLVYNIGRTPVYAELKYGTKVMWHGVADKGTIAPGEKKILKNWGKSYYVTGLQVFNKTGIRAIVHCATEDDEYRLYADKETGAFDEIMYKLLKEIFVQGLKLVPRVGSGLAGIVNQFWPKNEPSVWDQIQDKVKALVDEKILHTISGILSGDLRYYRERITTLSEEIESGSNPNDIRIHYMNIAQDMVGFENKFKFTSDTPNYQDVNQYILPHFSAFILLKISFYVIGIRDSAAIGLTEENVKSITSYANKTVFGDNGANKYITELYKDRVDNAYSTWYSEDLYNDMMNVRTYISTQGLEYMVLWNHMINNPQQADQNPYNDVISYSTFYGRQTPNLIHEATPEDLIPPLTPKLINGRRNKVSYIDFFIWRMNKGEGEPKIGGLRMYFENGDSYTRGTVTKEIRKIQFGGSTLIKLEVHGRGALDFFVFYFSDGRKETCGTKEYHEYHTVFEMKDHHIVAIFIASDNYSLGGQAANVSVAYQLNEDISLGTN